MLSPRVKLKNVSLQFLRQLQESLQQAEKAETIPSIQRLLNRLKTIRANLTKGIEKRQQFQDLISKCEVILKQKLRTAKIKGKFVSPPPSKITKAKSEKKLPFSKKYNLSHASSQIFSKVEYDSSDFISQSNENLQNSEINQKLVSLRREIQKQKEQKYKLRNKVDELHLSNKYKEQQLQDLKNNAKRVQNQIQNVLEIQNEQIASKRQYIHKNCNFQQNREKIKNKNLTKTLVSSITKDATNQQKESRQSLVRLFQQRIQQKNIRIENLQDHISTMQSQNKKLKMDLQKSSSDYNKKLQSLQQLLKRSNQNLQLSIKQKSELQETISGQQIKNKASIDEINSLIVENNSLKKQIQKNKHIIENKKNENKKDPPCIRKNINQNTQRTYNDKMILFQSLAQKQKQIALLKQNNTILQNERQVLTTTLKIKQKKIIELEQLLNRKLSEEQQTRTQFARINNQQFHNIFKKAELKEKDKRFDFGSSRSLEITRKLNKLEEIRNLIRQYPNGH